ncbi:cytochrome d ubiquinol oxidase subunit II [Odoribacter laneus]|uniref:cytochrome d ubiquinol oxidase subunit II n=1 Tax=Odoribacter laneus TaxID=626933 RepID=UPI003994D8C8
MSLYILQHYWWILISILGGALVFLLFVQGGQSMLYTLGKTKEERDLIVNSLGHKWELTFTTLVVFGGAFFASFPLFYATSFGGAYVVWMLILFCFVFQAVSFEYRSKPRNFLGSRTYEVFLMINGYAGPLLLGAAVATFFTGSPFRLSPLHQVEWLTPWRGLDALFVFTNYLLAFAVFFLARTMACLYFITNLEDDNLQIRCRKQLWYNTIPFLITFLLFLAFILTGDGYGILQNGSVGAVPYKYFYNLLEMPVNTLLFILGVIAVLFGIFKTLARPQWKKGIWFAAPGTILAVLALFILAGFNNTAFYPSYADPASSLTIYNASSSEYTLKAMSYVSLIIPFIILYIWYVWRAMTRKPMSIQEIKDTEHKY